MTFRGNRESVVPTRTLVYDKVTIGYDGTLELMIVAVEFATVVFAFVLSSRLSPQTQAVIRGHGIKEKYWIENRRGRQEQLKQVPKDPSS